MKKLIVCSALLSVIFAGSAFADTISYDDNVAYSAAGWSTTLSFAQFDSSLGNLNSVTIELYGEVLGTIEAENRALSAATIDASLLAQIDLDWSGGGSLISQVLPAYSTSFAATAYDGVNDAGGTSGFTASNVTGSDTDTVVYTSLVDLLSFIGTSTISFDISSTGSSSATGSGNLSTYFDTNASASVKITYDYTPTSAVPEPATMLLFGSGLTGLAFLRRRRK